MRADLVAVLLESVAHGSVCDVSRTTRFSRPPRTQQNLQRAAVDEARVESHVCSFISKQPENSSTSASNHAEGATHAQCPQTQKN